jgi:histone acetyltransferase (RNA polymerase elongator complex component)
VISIKKKHRHFTIPIFIPMAACPFHCIFCDQDKISGKNMIPDANDVITIINEHLSTISAANSDVEVGFFGGTFTGLPVASQKDYFDAVLPFIENGKISGIRLSTRPDFIDQESLSFLKTYPVRTIELGAQSMDDEVLKKSGRGHSSKDTEVGSRMILEADIRLGLQMMIGLPGDSEEKSIFTARRIIELGASETRIYPVIVIKDTPLEDLYRNGKYIPLELEDAVQQTKKVVKVFDDSDVKIIRIGLHPSEGLLNKNDYVAGPFHPSFRELVNSSVWSDRFQSFIGKGGSDSINIRVHPSDINVAIGYNGKNRKLLQQQFRRVKFTADRDIKENNFYADYS